MRTGVFLDYSGGFREAVEHIAVLEKQGVNLALVAEATQEGIDPEQALRDAVRRLA